MSNNDGCYPDGERSHEEAWQIFRAGMQRVSLNDTHDDVRRLAGSAVEKLGGQGPPGQGRGGVLRNNIREGIGTIDAHPRSVATILGLDATTIPRGAFGEAVKAYLASLKWYSPQGMFEGQL